MSATPDRSVLFRLRANGTFRRVCRIISGRYLATESTWAPQQSIGDRWKQFLGIFGGGLGERKGGSWQWSHSLLSCAEHSQTHLVEAVRETQHPNITPAKWGWTEKIKWLHWASWQTVRKSSTPPPIQSFHKQCEKSSSDLCSISAESREAVCFHMQCLSHSTLRQTVCSSAMLLWTFPKAEL